MPTYRLDLGYDGTGFHGYAHQPEVRTVQGVLEGALFRITGPVETVVAGRTDAGVHAWGQVVSFSSGLDLDGPAVARSLNKMLAPEVVVWACATVPDGFDARFSAKTRTYRYRVLARPVPDPFLHRTTWHVAHPLDREAMQQAAAHLIGEHDFASFCRRAAGRGTVREVLAAEWVRESADLLCFEVTAGSFCHQMVRSFVAACVAVGRGRLAPDDMPRILEARDRNAAAGAAPPHGLVLWQVSYE